MREFKPINSDLYIQFTLKYYKTGLKIVISIQFKKNQTTINDVTAYLMKDKQVYQQCKSETNNNKNIELCKNV